MSAGTVAPVGEAKAMQRVNRGSGWAAITVGLLAAYAIVDGLFVGIPTIQLAIYASLVVLTAIAALAMLGHSRLKRTESVILIAILAVILGGLVGTATQSVFYPVYVVGDAASIVLLALFVVVAAAAPRSLFSESALWLLWVTCFVASLLSPILGVDNGRYDPPSPFLIGATVGLVCVGGRSIKGLAAVAALVVLVILAYYSGFRTHVGLTGLGLMIAVGRLLGPRAVVVLMAGLLLAAAANLPAIGNYLSSQAVVSDSRFRDIASGEADQSVLERVLEVRDAWFTAEESWSNPQWIVGAGHGATYVPSESNIVRNITNENRVHNIHVGPALVFFRYGLVGVAALAALYVLVTRRCWTQFFDPRRTPGICAAFPWIMLMYLADFLVRNVMIDPFFAYSLAGLALSNTLRDKERAV